MIEFEIRLRQHRLEDVEARENLLPVLLAVRAAVAGVLDLFTHDDDATRSAASLQKQTADVSAGGRSPPAGRTRRAARRRRPACRASSRNAEGL